MHFTKWLLQGIKPHVVSHGILTKLSSLSPLYSIFFFLQFPNNKAGHTSAFNKKLHMKCNLHNIFDSYEYIIVF